VTVNPTLERLVDTRQYFTTLDGGRPQTFGKRYVFSSIDRSTYSMQVRVGYTVKPDLNVDVYAEPFAASGRYYDRGELPLPGARLLRVYGQGDTTATELPNGGLIVNDGGASFTLANRNFNRRSFRSNLVVRWEWRLGSTLYVVWQQDRSRDRAVGDRINLGDMFGSLSAPGSNLFVVKTSFWIPIR
jgi:hypothetical protein